jgi:transposase
VIDERAIGDRYRAVAGELNERQRRVWAGAEAVSHGRGGQAAVARATGMSVTTVAKGMGEVRAGERLEPGRVRSAGGGRKSLAEGDPSLLEDLRVLVSDGARGDPESPLLWTAKSVRALARALRQMGHQVSHETVAKLLRGLGFSLQANRKTLEGASHPDRDAQFAHINASVAGAQAAGQPTISVDTKKKELIGDFKNPGRQWRAQGEPTLVRTKDFKDKQLGKVNPYGIYDLKLDEGYVSVGIDADTAEFAVNAIRSWWTHLGAERYPNATTLTITADCGGSNGNRLRLWKTELQRLADDTGLQIQVCHFPPGTSKWRRVAGEDLTPRRSQIPA